MGSDKQRMVAKANLYPLYQFLLALTIEAHPQQHKCTCREPKVNCDILYNHYYPVDTGGAANFSTLSLSPPSLNPSRLKVKAGS